jgi:hypothetical protein
MVVDAVAVQPTPVVVAVTTTLYVVVSVGVTIVDAPAAPELHSYDIVPVPVALTKSVAGLPTQRVDGVADTLVMLTDEVSIVQVTAVRVALTQPVVVLRDSA